jgi:hypothetical protein
VDEKLQQILNAGADLIRQTEAVMGKDSEYAALVPFYGENGLSLESVFGRTRICLNGRPLIENKWPARLEASKHLSNFLVLLDSAKSDFMNGLDDLGLQFENRGNR